MKTSETTTKHNTYNNNNQQHAPPQQRPPRDDDEPPQQPQAQHASQPAPPQQPLYASSTSSSLFLNGGKFASTVYPANYGQRIANGSCPSSSSSTVTSRSGSSRCGSASSSASSSCSSTRSTAINDTPHARHQEVAPRKRSLHEALSNEVHIAAAHHLYYPQRRKSLKVSSESTPTSSSNTTLHTFASNSTLASTSTATSTSMAYPHSNHNHMQQACKTLVGLEAYEKIAKLGEGTYGVVFLAKDKRTNECVALKKVKTGLSENEKKTGFPITSIREIKILQNLDHENIVRLREVVRSSNIGFVFLVFEYYEHDLASLIDTKMKSYFNISEIKCILKQLVSAIQYAHKHFVIHRDIKLSNILLNNNGHIVLCDWGLARLYSNPLKQHTSNVVTLWYRAPELLLGSNQYHTAIDMWAIGCIVGELVLHRPLLQGRNEFEQVQLIYELLGAPNHHIWPNYNQLPNIVNGTFQQIEQQRQKYKFNNIDQLFVQFGANLLDLIKQLLAYDPSKRITAKNALFHPWFDDLPKACAKDMMPTFPAKINLNQI